VTPREDEGDPAAAADAIADRDRQDRALFAALRAGDDPGARDALIERFLPLARQLARRYWRSDEPLDDLVQVASLGLVKAIDRFDSARQVSFSSYAVPTILGEIKRHFRDRTWSIHVPRDLQELSLRIDRAVAALSRELQRSPSVSELSAALGASEEQILEALDAAGAYRTASIDAPRGDGEEPGETVGAAIGTEEAGYGLAESRATLDRLLRAISPREREVLRLRFEEDLTQAEIGERIGVSQMQVSRVLRQTLARLRAMARVD
jgi:RNA polymerase sigma-B factor